MYARAQNATAQYAEYEKLLEEHRESMSKCFECHSENLAHTEGEVICTDCGVVQAIGCISERAEWRNCFSEDAGGKSEDASRVGYSFDKKLSTQIGLRGKNAWRLRQLNTRMHIDPKNVIQVTRMLELACQYLELPEPVFYASRDMATDFLNSCIVRSKDNQQGVATACVFFACFDLTGGTRTVEEIDAVMKHCYPRKELQKPTARSESSGNAAAFKMVQEVYQTLLEKFPSKYRNVLRLPQRDTEADTLKRMIAQVSEITVDKRHPVYRKVMNMRDLMATDRRLKNTEPNILNAVLIYMACILYKIPGVSNTSFCKQMDISSTTLCNKETAILDILKTDPTMAAKIMRA